MKTEKQKMLAGELFTSHDPELEQDLINCAELIYLYNQLRPSQSAERKKLLKQILGQTKNDLHILPPFYCDYGYNISVGEDFFANYNLTILDSAKVTIGDNVMIGPNVGIYTPNHPINGSERRNAEEIILPVTIGNDVWIGGSVTILPGVTIGNNVVVGAGSVVTKDIPSNSIAVGNPCKVIKKIEN